MLRGWRVRRGGGKLGEAAMAVGMDDPPLRSHEYYVAGGRGFGEFRKIGAQARRRRKRRSVAGARLRQAGSGMAGTSKVVVKPICVLR